LSAEDINIIDKDISKKDTFIFLSFHLSHCKTRGVPVPWKRSEAFPRNIYYLLLSSYEKCAIAGSSDLQKGDGTWIVSINDISLKDTFIS